MIPALMSNHLEYNTTQFDQLLLALSIILHHHSYSNVVLFCGNSTDERLVVALMSASNSENHTWICHNHDLPEPTFPLNAASESQLQIVLLKSVETYQTLSNITTRDFFKSNANTVYISNGRSNIELVTHFMKHLWKLQLVKSVLVFWTETTEIWHYNPFAKDFAVPLINQGKLDQIKGKMFFNQVSNFHNHNFSVFMYHNPPKVMYFPSRIRMGKNFYFGGRDGFITSIISRKLNFNFNYTSINSDQLIKFAATDMNKLPISTDLTGLLIKPDTVLPWNLHYIDIKSNMS